MKDMRVYAAQVLECVERIKRYTEAMDEQVFLADSMVQDAVIRNLEVIGEAARRVSEEYRAAHPHVPWRSMTALRNVLIHDYERVDPGQLWRVVARDLPPLHAALKALLAPLDRLEAELAGEEVAGEESDDA